MSFRASFCDPFKAEIIELGKIQEDEIINKFESIDWSDYLTKMKFVEENKIYYSPSLEVENSVTKHGLSISAVGEPGNFEFYIFYKRPKIVKKFLGFGQKTDNDYTTDKTEQTKQDVLNCLNALIKNDTDYLANKIGK